MHTIFTLITSSISIGIIAYYATTNRRAAYYDLSSDGLSTVSAQVDDVASHINRYIDLNSMVDTYLLQEITCDPDIGWSSFFLDFDLGEGADHRLRFEAPWDYDSAIGNRGGYCEDAKGYYAYGSSNPWLTLLTGQSFFQEMAKAKWAKLLEENCFQSLFDTLHLYSQKYAGDYERNFERWNHMGGNYGGTSGELRSETRSVYSQNDARAFVEDWLGDRLTYLSGVYGDGRDLHCGKALAESAPEGTTLTRLEAENGLLLGSATRKTDSAASGGGYIGNLDDDASAGVSFTYDASSAGKAYIGYGLAKQINSRDPSEIFELSINGKVVEFPERRNAQAADSGTRYHDWGYVYMGEVELKEGENAIQLRSRGSSTNFDYIDLYTL